MFLQQALHLGPVAVQVQFPLFLAFTDWRIVKYSWKILKQKMDFEFIEST